MLAQPENYLLCCEAAGGYVDTVQNLTLDISQSSSCSSSYNEQPEGNFNGNDFNNLEQQTQYVFPSIQFGCKGCISNVTFYTRSQKQPADFTIFNILLWGHHRNITENSEVFELRQNYSVNVTEPLTFMDWNADSYSTTITHLVIEAYVSIQDMFLGCLFLAQGNLIWRSSERERETERERNREARETMKWPITLAKCTHLY